MTVECQLYCYIFALKMKYYLLRPDLSSTGIVLKEHKDMV